MNNMNNLTEFKKEFEREMLIKIIIGLRYGKISNEQAQVLAKEYLNASNEGTEEKILSRLFSLIEKYTDMLELYIQLANKYFSEKREQVLTMTREYLLAQEYELALKTLKGGMN